MASFENPVQETQDPNYIYWSRPSREQPRPDESKAIMIKGIGNEIEQGAKGLQEAVSEGVTQDAYKQATKLDEQKISDLSSMVNASDPDTKSQGNPVSILGSEEKQLPEPIQNLPKQAQALQSAKETKNITQSYYDMQRWSLAKELRTKYPGYHEEIDRGFAEASREPSANAVARDMLQRIAEGGAAQKSEMEKTLQVAREHMDIPGMPQQYDDLASGKKTISQFNHWYSGEMSWKYKLEQDKASHDENTMSREDQTQDATDRLDALAHHTQLNTMGAMVLRPGMMTGAQMADTIRDMQLNPDRVDPEKARDLEVSIQALKNYYQTQVDKEANQPDADGRSIVQKMGPEAYKARVALHASVFDDMQEAIHNKDFGIAFAIANKLKAVEDQSTYDLTSGKDTDPEVKQFSRNMFALRRIMGDQGSAFYIQQTLGSNMPEKFKDYMLDTKSRIINQNSDPLSPPKTITQAVDEAKARNIKAPEVYDDYVKMVGLLNQKDVRPEAKMAVARAFFDPANREMMSRFKAEGYTDPTTGQQVQSGKYAVWTRLTSPDIVRSIHKLATSQGMPEAERMYKDWVEDSFAHQLFFTDIGSMRDVQDTPWLHLAYHTSDERGGARLEILDQDGKPLGQQAAQYMHAHNAAGIGRSIDNLNKGLRGLQNVEEGLNGDVDSYLIDMLTQAGFDPSKAQGIPDKILQAVASAHKPAKMKGTFPGQDEADVDKNKNQGRVVPGRNSHVSGD